MTELKDMNYNELLKEFLPASPIDGKIGYYPCANKKEYEQLPLPMKCITWFDNKVKYVEFDTWFDNYMIRAKTLVHRENVHKVLFISSQGQTQLYSVSAVVFEDGKRTFAKWWQDGQTGAFQISSISGHVFGRQGGYNGFIPENCYKDEHGKWMLNSCIESKNINHASF